jgi:hypothetical protein
MTDEIVQNEGENVAVEPEQAPEETAPYSAEGSERAQQLPAEPPATENTTAQIPVSEPFEPVSPPAAPTIDQNAQNARNLWAKALRAIQFRKRKRIDKILTLFNKKQSITNDDVEKLLHVSDATATRYLKTLVTEGKLRRIGHTGRGVRYEKI